MGVYAALKPYSLLEPYLDPSITYPELFKSPCPAHDMRHFLLVRAFLSIPIPDTPAQGPLNPPPD